MKILAETYGRPDQLIKSQIQKVRALPAIKESGFDGLLNFAIKVINMTIFIQSARGNNHLANPLLLSWKSFYMLNIASIVDLSNLLKDIRKVINMASDSLPVTANVVEKQSNGYA